MQEGAGLDVVTDGELRRHTFIDQLLEAVMGLTPDPEGWASDHIPVPFHDEGGAEQSVFAIPISVTAKVVVLVQLALSTQCGFASAGPGNSISEDAEERKLQLIAEVARRVWG